ncbi:hypothetical protein BDV95DRAFT_574668 [Massariosphaeria phaeospora]|uniref:Uncharacterized protein n=1 Tax=Massariosphaeria phaeospora TaxID=100035 RepID=A0A7C8I4Q9_9PLEO|nr:hypothetical protein BDV95DRAFT_574668 [Massariosphaeria phaeospora]
MRRRAERRIVDGMHEGRKFFPAMMPAGEDEGWAARCGGRAESSDSTALACRRRGHRNNDRRGPPARSPAPEGQRTDCFAGWGPLLPLCGVAKQGLSLPEIAGCPPRPHHSCRLPSGRPDCQLPDGRLHRLHTEHTHRRAPAGRERVESSRGVLPQAQRQPVAPPSTRR